MVVNIPQITGVKPTCKTTLKYPNTIPSPPQVSEVETSSLSHRFHSPAGGLHWKLHQLPDRDF